MNYATMQLDVVDLKWNEDIKDVRIRVLDQTGTLISLKGITMSNGAARIDVSSLKTGLYVIELESNGKVSSTTVEVLR